MNTSWRDPGEAANARDETATATADRPSAANSEFGADTACLPEGLGIANLPARERTADFRLEPHTKAVRSKSLEIAPSQSVAGATRDMSKTNASVSPWWTYGAEESWSATGACCI